LPFIARITPGRPAQKCLGSALARTVIDLTATNWQPCENQRMRVSIR
jgi:hypothetical protein